MKDNIPSVALSQIDIGSRLLRLFAERGYLLRGRRPAIPANEFGIRRKMRDLEAVFRGLKSELGLRPVFHHKEERTEGHLFITVLAYQLVQTIRRKLEAAGETISWSRLREILSVQQRVTVTFRQRDGRTLHVRKATAAEPALRKIYDALGIDAAPGGVRKLIV